MEQYPLRQLALPPTRNQISIRLIQVNGGSPPKKKKKRLSMKKAMSAVALVLLPLVPASGLAGGLGRGNVFFGGGFWGRGFWGPYWGPSAYGGPGYYAYPNTGEVKLDTKVKDAQVFINGAYAGTTQEDKKMHLRPGTYNIEIREAGHTQYAEKVYVASGKTLHLHPGL